MKNSNIRREIILVLYHYMEMIGAPTKFNYSSQLSNHVSNSSFNNNNEASLHPVISALHVMQKIISECCRRIGNKAD